MQTDTQKNTFKTEICGTIRRALEICLDYGGRNFAERLGFLEATF